ncbi:hypothetical protein LUZ60_014820 [Juncus effusus]|nr:hypothetical protein LUZ60_014820 [Juncus effusus]
MATKRAYKLQEFVAHESAVNCLKIGKKTSRLLLTGGEDNKVNLWSIGKPNAILSLSGHTSPVECVNFDPSEVLVAGGAASGTIKLWDLEEAKVMRSLTGHRSNCMSIDFHPFGEFFASGSLDTNLKIWDIRRKSCIHTYKGHTRGVNILRFTPDGKWIVSGGEDSSVKIWDLTAGRLLNDFKMHEGQIQCLDFHPNEFLLATGSADKTVKFWDLETFEMIGSSGPETVQGPNDSSPQVPLAQQMLRYAGGVRSMTFNKDGKTMFCGLHESMKVLSWEPMRCHDIVDVGWSKLSDLHVHDGKLLGCSSNQSCVGIWVVDLAQVEPYAVKKAGLGVREQTESNITATFARLSVSKANDNQPSTPKRNSVSSKPALLSRKITPKPLLTKSDDADVALTVSKPNSKETTIPIPLSRTRQKIDSSTNKEIYVAPVIVPRTNPKEPAADVALPKIEIPKVERESRDVTSKENQNSEISVPKPPRVGTRRKHIGEDSDKEENTQNARIAINRENRENFVINRNLIRHRRSVTAFEEPIFGRERNLDLVRTDTVPVQTFNVGLRGTARAPVVILDRSKNSNTHEGIKVRPLLAGKETESTSDEDSISDILENHNEFLTTCQTRLTKLQVVHRLWMKSDLKGVTNAMEKMSDHAVLADFINILMEKSENITLDFCTSLLPLVTSLFESRFDRHLSVALEMLHKLVKNFGSMIYSTVNAPPSVGVDLHMEERLERCNLCFIELEKVKTSLLPPILRRGGSVGKSAQELNLFLQDIIH